MNMKTHTVTQKLHAIDIARLRQGIDDIEAGRVTHNAAKLRYLAALVSRYAVINELPRHTDCRWDITDARNYPHTERLDNAKLR